jgi:hypothetical protein
MKNKNCVKVVASLYARYTYRVVIEQGEANGLLLMTRGPPYLAHVEIYKLSK